MEIKDAHFPLRYAQFSEMKPGETFEHGDNTFMRTAPRSNIDANAVVLADGRLVSFVMDEPVRIVRAHVVREG